MTDKHKPKIIIDLDGVIAGPKPVEGDYADCEPNEPVIERLRTLQRLGWIIAIYTSRNVRSFDHNEGRMAAVTLPKATAWLQRVQCPFDELWLNKPWTGSVGVYVDDRAVLPHELVNLSANELLERARAVAFDPSKPGWRYGSEQHWTVFDARANDWLESSQLPLSINAERVDGRRSLVLLPATYIFPPGLDEELRRNGARYGRFAGDVPAEVAAGELTRELFSTNEAGYGSNFRFMASVTTATSRLHGRHFNTLLVSGGRVVKTSIDQDKLRLERAWLKHFEALAPGPVLENVNGYSTALGEGGSLAQVLLRANINALDMESLTSQVVKLWSRLKNPGRTPTAVELNRAHHQFQLLTSEKIVDRLQLLFAETWISAWSWTVNGVAMGYLEDVCERLQDLLTDTTAQRYGILHGDLCPGNIVLMNSVHADEEADLRLIDPRGDELYGDLLYDVGKLAHALRWGYDSLVEGWYDCFWNRTDERGLELHLKLWDEEVPQLRPNRIRLWNLLAEVLTLDTLTLDSREVHATAALQLISCAPLHKEDPKRMMALVARGLQAATVALGMSE